MRSTFPQICPGFSALVPQEIFNDRHVGLERTFWLFLSLPITDLFPGNVSGNIFLSLFRCTSQWDSLGFLLGSHCPSLRVSHEQQTVVHSVEN